MSSNRYMKGVAALAARGSRRPASPVLGDFNWGMLAQAFGVPTGSSTNPMDILYTGGPAAGRGAAGSSANGYWNQQRAAARQTPWASTGVSRQQAALQLQQVLRQQQQANLASLQSQLAQMSPATAAAFPAQYSAPAPLYPQQQPYDQGSPSDGGDQTVVGDDSEPAVVIRVKNMADVIRAQSALGNLALSATPDLIKNIAYGQMRDELKKNLADKGLIADVSLSSPPNGKAPTSGIVLGALIGAGAIGVGALLWRFIRGGR